MFIKKERKIKTLASGETKEYTNIKIVDNIRVGNKTKHITLETFGSLEKQENKEEFMSMVNKRLLELKEERISSINLKVNKVDNKNSSSINIEQNYGYKILESIYDYLELDKYFDDFQDKLETKIQYKLSEIFKFIVIESTLNPDSKVNPLQMLNKLYDKKYSFNLDDIYDSLDNYVKVFDGVQIHIRDRINTLIENSSDKIYYDVTNYYQEVAISNTENDLRQRGVSKPHIVSHLGLSYISLVVLRILQYILEQNDLSLSKERIIRVLNAMALKEITEDYINLNSISGNQNYKEIYSTKKSKNVQTGIITKGIETYQDFLKINKIFKLDLDYAFIEKKKFIKELNKIKISKDIINSNNVNDTIEKKK